MLKRGEKPEDLLNIVFRDIPFDVIQKQDLAYRCTCSKERVEHALITLGYKEVKSLLEEHGGADVKCEFCLEMYHITRDDLESILNDLSDTRVLH
jgi:molecular chaperone Hsp33